MKKNLQSLYIKTDTSCKELAKTALAQLVLKIVYSFSEPQKLDAIKQELNGILDARFNNEKVQEIIDFLVDEKKII